MSTLFLHHIGVNWISFLLSNKIFIAEQIHIELAAPRGLEPRFPVSETGVLPA